MIKWIEIFFISSIIIGSLAVNYYPLIYCSLKLSEECLWKSFFRHFSVCFFKERESSKRPFFSSSFSAFVSPVLKAKNALMLNRWSGRLEPFSLPPSTSLCLCWCARGEVCIFFVLQPFWKRTRAFASEAEKEKFFFLKTWIHNCEYAHL